MSLLHTCPECEKRYETGLGASGGLCDACERARRIIEKGGRGLSIGEHADLAAFLGAAVPPKRADDRVPLVLDELVGGLAIGQDGRVLDLHTLEGHDSLLVPDEVLPTDTDAQEGSA